MNELSCKVDAEAIAQTLWQQVVSIGWIESVQNSIDELYQDMLRDNLKSGMYAVQVTGNFPEEIQDSLREQQVFFPKNLEE